MFSDCGLKEKLCHAMVTFQSVGVLNKFPLYRMTSLIMSTLSYIYFIIQSNEVIQLRRELEKLKEQFVSQEGKTKWAHNKLRQEIDAHKVCTKEIYI